MTDTAEAPSTTAGPAGARPLLEVEGVQKHFPGRATGLLGRRGNPIKAVDGVTFTVHEGETLGLVGESGCGKTSIALALATQAAGEILIFEKMFENRLFFVDKLVAMGARITLCDPHRAIVSGPSRLHGERVESPDIRAGMAMLIAALAAEGRSEIGNIIQIDRGYEQIDERLRALGAQIERVSVDGAAVA